MSKFNSERQIEIVWSVEDVQEVRPDLDDEQSMEVLYRVLKKHDASIGVSWDVIEFWADELYPEGQDD